VAGEVTLPEVTVEGAAPAPPSLSPTTGLFNPFASGDFVAIKKRDGSFSAVEGKDLSAAIATGAKPATEAEYLGAKGGLVGKVASGAIGVARGATFGLSDVAAIEASRMIGGESEAEDTRRALNIARQANPTETVAGDLVGSLAGMALIPAGAAGGGVRGTSAIARAGSRIASAAPRLAAEGAAIGLGHQASEDALGNHELVGQQYVASAFKGAVLGLIVGGALHGVGGAVGDRLGGYVGRAAETTESTVAKEGGVLRRAGDFAADQAELRAFQSTGAKLRDFERLGRTAEAQAERAQRIGRRMLEDEVVTPLATQEKIAQRAAVELRKAGKELEAMRGALDKAATRPSWDPIVRRFEEEVLKPSLALPLGEAEARPAAEFLDAMLTKGGATPDFATLHKFRRALDAKLEKGGEYARSAIAPAKTGAEGMRQLRRIVEEEFEAAAEKAAAETGETFAAKYKLAKEVYADYATVNKILAKEATARARANQTISLTDVISAAGGFAQGGLTGGVSGLALGAANHVRRKFGDQLAAHALDTGARLLGVQRTVGANTAAIQGGVKAFLSGAAPKTTRPAPQITAATVRAVRAAVQDNDALVARVSDAMAGGGLNVAAPKVAQAVVSTAMRAASHLRAVTPKEPPPSGVSFIPQKPRPMSESELAKFANTLEAITDPMSIVDDLQQGRLSREKVNALRVVYPDLYQQMRKEVIAQSIQLRPELTDQQQIALSILFDAPISAMMQPKVIQSFQKTFAQGADPQQAGQAGGQPAQPGRGLRRLPPLASGFDKQEAPT